MHRRLNVKEKDFSAQSYNIRLTALTVVNSIQGITGPMLISLCLARSPPSTSSDFVVLCKCLKKIILTSLYLVEGLAWYDWPFTYWTDQLLSFSA